MTNPRKSLFEELKRRSVIRIGVAYLVIAWLVAQVADSVSTRSMHRLGS